MKGKPESPLKLRASTFSSLMCILLNPPLFPSPIDYVLPLSERKWKCDYGDIIDFQVWLAELVSLL